MASQVSVKLILKTDKKEKIDGFPVYARITYERKTSYFSTGIHYRQKEWDDNIGQPKNQVTDKASNLRSVYDKVLDIVKRLQQEELPISAKSIKLRYGANTPSHGITLTEYFNQFIEHIDRDTNNYGKATVNHYRTTLRHLTNFLKRSNHYHTEITIPEVKYKLLKQFQDYLVNVEDWNIEKSKLSFNTAMKYHKKFKCVLQEAYKDELINRNPYQHFTISEIHASEKEILSLDEIKKLEQADFSHNPRYDRARDLYLFSLLCACRPSEALQLTKENLEIKDDTWYVTFMPSKTSKLGVKKRLSLPPRAIKILKKYHQESIITGMLLPKWNYNSLREQLHKVIEELEINKNITPGSARRGISTLMRANGVPLENIQTLNGHKDIRTTHKYYAMQTDGEFKRIAERIEDLLQ